MPERKYACPYCDTLNERPAESAPAVIEMVCWTCDKPFLVNQYKHTVHVPEAQS